MRIIVNNPCKQPDISVYLRGSERTYELKIWNTKKKAEVPQARQTRLVGVICLSLSSPVPKRWTSKSHEKTSKQINTLLIR